MYSIVYYIVLHCYINIILYINLMLYIAIMLYIIDIRLVALIVSNSYS